MLSYLTELFSMPTLLGVGGSLVRVLALLFAGWVVVRIARKLVPKLTRKVCERMTARAGEGATDLQKRSNTLGRILLSVAVVVAWMITGLMALRELGFDIAPILAGAGVLGLAVGFGAKNLVSDVISGTFILLENQVRVGDVVVINGTAGLVERMTLRTMTLRSLDGAVHVIPNGTVQTMSNHTYDYSYYVFEIGVNYAEDVTKVMDHMSEVSDELQNDETLGDDILNELEHFGLDRFGDSALVIKSRIKTRPGQQWAIGRELNRRFKKRFDEVGINIPFPHRVLVGAPTEPAMVLRQDESNGDRRLAAN